MSFMGRKDLILNNFIKSDISNWQSKHVNKSSNNIFYFLLNWNRIINKIMFRQFRE